VPGLAADFRYAVRSLTGAPAFTIAAIASLALAIGANASIFSVANALLLRPLPYAHADRLVILWNTSPGLGIVEDWFSTAQYFDVRTRTSSFEDVAIAIGANYNQTGGGDPERVGVIRVSSNLLPMLGAHPAIGRGFAAADDQEGAAPSAILNHATWMRRFGGDPAAVGRDVILNGVSYRVIGVMPESFSLRREVLPTLGLAGDAEVLLPLPLGVKAPAIRNREDYNLLARLKTGVSLDMAQADADRLTTSLRGEHPDVYPANGGLRFRVVALNDQVVGGVRRSLLLLSAAVALVLLIACANVANLLLSRAVEREREMAVRLALGAGRRRIVRQLLIESLILALAGGLAGLLLAAWSLEAIRSIGRASVPRIADIRIDARVFLFTFAISTLVGVLFGLLPGLRTFATDLQRGLKAAGRGASGGAVWGRGHGARRLFVASEVALAAMVLVGAGLLVRSFAKLQAVPAGFDASSVLTFELTMTGQRYSDARIVGESYRQLWSGLEALPGVQAAGGVSALPLSGMMAWGPVTIEGRAGPRGAEIVNVDQRIVGGAYFSAMRIPLVEGRLFDEHDVRENPRVVIVDDRMAAEMWPGRSAIGKRLRSGGMDANANAPWLTVIGVVGRVKQDALDSDSRMAVYYWHQQSPTRAMNTVVRANTETSALAAAAREVVRQLDPNLPIYNMKPMAARVAESLGRRRFAMLLFALFGAVSLLLAAVGVYGVVAHVVSQGTRDIGIRMALGATPRRVMTMVLRSGLTLAGVGLAAGLAAAIGAARLMSSLLFGVTPFDAVTFGAIAALLLTVALIAIAIPAHRASRVNPLESLRSE
jgi:predicted permease